jgi:hypothetical protein
VILFGLDASRCIRSTGERSWSLVSDMFVLDVLHVLNPDKVAWTRG